MESRARVQQNIDQIFGVHSINQVRQYATASRNEMRSKQHELRQLVGDRYSDVIASADLMMEMREQCQQLLTQFDQPPKLATLDRPKVASNHTQLRRITDFIASTVQHAWQWLDAGLLLNATVDFHLSRALLAHTVKNGPPPADPELVSALKTASDHLGELPATLLAHCKRRPIPQPPYTWSLDAPWLTQYGHALATLLLLHPDLTILAAVGQFLDLSHERIAGLRDVPQQSEAPQGRTRSRTVSMLAALQGVIFWVDGVFVSGVVPLVPRLERETHAMAPVYASTVAPGAPTYLMAPLQTVIDERLSQPLPPHTEIEAACRQWVQDKAQPVILGSLRNELSAMKCARSVIDVERELLELIQGFTGACGPGRGRAGTSVWHGGAWETLVRNAVDDRTRELVGQLFAELPRLETPPPAPVVEPTTPVSGAPPAPTRGAPPLVGVGDLRDEDIASRYRFLSSAGGRRGEGGSPSTLAGVIGSGLSPWGQNFCEKLYKGLLLVLEDMNAFLHRERVARGAKAEKNTGQSLQQLIHTTLLQTLKGTCADLKRDEGTPESSATSQVVSRILQQLVQPFCVGLGIQSNDLMELRKSLHSVYLAGFREWTTTTRTAFTAKLREVVFGTYWGPDEGMFRRLHASAWVSRKGLPLPVMPLEGVVDVLLDCSRAISALNPSVLRVAVVHALHDGIGQDVFAMYYQLAKDPNVLIPVDPEAEEPAPPPTGPTVCEAGWIQMLFDLRALGAVLLRTTPEATAAKTLYGDAIKAVERHIDPINLQACNSAFDSEVGEFIQSVSVLLACHGVDTSGRAPATGTPDRPLTLMLAADSKERFALLPLLPLQTTGGTLLGVTHSTHSS